MSFKAEFQTVDLILASTASTRGVDAFALSLIKAERQVRKLFTHLVFQFPAFDETHVPALRNILGQNKNVYFSGFEAGFNALYPDSIESIVGSDYHRLRSRLKDAINHRNKIFHGQLTAQSLRRSDLVAFVEDIRFWCGHIASGSKKRFDYDGFERNSFRKSTVQHLSAGYRVQLATVDEYKDFMGTHMQR